MFLGRGTPVPLSSDYGAFKTVKARFWPSLSGTSRQTLSRCPLFARQRALTLTLTLTLPLTLTLTLTLPLAGGGEYEGGRELMAPRTDRMTRIRPWFLGTM